MNENNNVLFHDPKKLRRYVGISSFLLPTSLLIIGLILPQVCTYPTMSDYYFAPFGGDLLVGFLFFIGFFLIAYKGDFDYTDSTKWDDRLSTFAGICAFGIALFPIDGSSCGFEGEQIRAFINTSEYSCAIEAKESLATIKPTEQCSAGTCPHQATIDYSLFSQSGNLHSITTLGFFLSLAYFSIFIFTKTNPTSEMSPLKKKRNSIYKTTGYILISVIVLMGVKRFALAGSPYASMWDKYAITFFLEAIGLFAFGFAWWVKGGGYKSVQD